MTGPFGVQDGAERTQLTAFLDEYRGLLDAALDGLAVTGASRPELGIPESVEDSFEFGHDDTVTAVRARYREVCERSRAAVAGLSLDDTVTGRGRPITVRWLHLQVLRELAHHCGHADILREQVLAAG